MCGNPIEIIEMLAFGGKADMPISDGAKVKK
jgi:hypothetical protein